MSDRTQDNDLPEPPTAPRTAGLLIELFPIGTPGQTGFAIHNVGPEILSQDEAVRVLYASVTQLAQSATWEP